MKLNGNKVVAAVFVFAAGNTEADINPPNLTTFVTGTPAKASEVNANFQELKTYSANLQATINAQSNLISQLEEKLTELDDQNQYTISVTGDGELIGYASKIQMSSYKNYIPVLTENGMVSLEHGGEGIDENFALRNFDPIGNQRSGSDSDIRYYSDAQCQNLVYINYGYGWGNALFVSKVENTLDDDMLFITEGKVYLATKGTTFNPNATAIYSMEEEGCTQAQWFTAGLTIPVAESTKLKKYYATIEIEGYVVH